MSGVAMHSCVTRNAPREVVRMPADAVAFMPIPRSMAAAPRATNTATASTRAFSRESGLGVERGGHGKEEQRAPRREREYDEARRRRDGSRAANSVDAAHPRK